MRRLTVSAVIAVAIAGLVAPPAEARVLDAPTPSIGCGQAAPVQPDETVSRTVVSGGITREYLLHLPADYRPWRPTPLVLSFHGHRRTAAYQEKLSGFSDTRAIAVYPQGLVGTDGKTAWTGAPYSNPADDVLFTSDLLDQLQGELCVDPLRIYAAGKSNGGGFTGLLACRMSGRIAAFAPVSGAFYPQGGPCEPSRPAPILEFHGTADTAVRYDGNPAKGQPAIPNWLTDWANRNGCAPDPEVIDEGDGVQVSRWQDCWADVAHYRIEGLGHVWPSTSPNPDSNTPAAIDATSLIMRFFDQHPLA